jgi:serine/threonine protein kinase
MLLIEYLAPEFVFNLGHDHSADLWALGVMLYEFYMGGTPFAPKRPDNITELFNNIAVTKTNGVRIPAKLEERARNKIAGDLILLLLKPEPSERKGVQEGYTSVILEHEFFQELDVEALVNGTMKPVHIPSPPQSNVTLSTLPPIKSFKGDQKQFDFF